MMEADFSKDPAGLIPAIVQDAVTRKVLMLGYMNREALDATLDTKLVTFYSRSRQQLWTKGETSNNYLHLVDIRVDCDKDCFLISARPDGPVCHTGADTCFNENNTGDFIYALENIIEGRRNAAQEKSYTSQLFAKGVNAIAQKVGEEAVELVIEAKDNNRERFLDEAADLLFHYLILLRQKDAWLADVAAVLQQRHKK